MKKIVHKTKDYIRYHPSVEYTYVWMKGRTMPGFQGLSLFNVFKFLIDELRREAIVTRANSMSFSFFLALFPSILVIFSLLAYMPYIKRKDMQSFVKTSVVEIMPGNAGKMLETTVLDILKKPRRAFLSFSFALSLFFASNGMMALMRGFEKSHLPIYLKRTVLQKRLVSIYLTFLMGFLMLTAITLLILGNVLLNFFTDLFNISGGTKFFVNALRWGAILTVFYGGITLIYRYGAATRERLPFLNAGAALATCLSLVSSFLFQYYVDNFGQYNKIYGAIGSLIVLLLWIQINSFILLVGFELNASIAMNKSILQQKEQLNSTISHT